MHLHNGHHCAQDKGGGRPVHVQSGLAQVSIKNYSSKPFFITFLTDGSSTEESTYNKASTITLFLQDSFTDFPVIPILIYAGFPIGIASGTFLMISTGIPTMVLLAILVASSTVIHARFFRSVSAGNA